MHTIKVARRLAALGAIVALAGCGSVQQRQDAAISVELVVGAIKDDLREATSYLHWASAQPAKDDACKGMVNFDLGMVTVELNTLTTRNASGSVGATVPVSPFTLSLGASGSQDVTNTQTIRFVLAPKPTMTRAPAAREDPAARLDPAIYPITAGLRTLRNGLLSTSDKQPCILVGPMLDDPQQSKPFEGALVYTFALDAKAAGEGKVSFLIFSVGGATSSRAQASNKVSVTFSPTWGSTAWQQPQDDKL